MTELVLHANTLDLANTQFSGDFAHSAAQTVDDVVVFHILDGLVASGIKDIQITSFVNPRAIPQMADSREIARVCLEKYPDLHAFALVPNLAGVDNAVAAGIHDLSFVISLTQGHNTANVRKTMDQSFEELTEAMRRYPHVTFCVDTATAFGCPFDGIPSYETLKERVMRIQDMGIKVAQISDTIGIATPKDSYRVFSQLIADFPEMSFRSHFHDTRGLGMASTLAAIDAGVTMVETSLAGLGGCPFAPGASGNLATEDLVYALDAMEIPCGVDFDTLKETAVFAKDHIQGNFSGHHIFINEKNCRTQ